MQEPAGQRAVCQQPNAARLRHGCHVVQRAAVEQRDLHLMRNQWHVRVEHRGELCGAKVRGADVVNLARLLQVCQMEGGVNEARGVVVPPVKLHEVQPFDSEPRQ